MGYKIYIIEMIFKFILGSLILIRIYSYFINQIIANFKKQRQKPTISQNNIQARLRKANKQYYKQFK